MKDDPNAIKAALLMEEITAFPPKSIDAADWLAAPDDPDTPLVTELIEEGEMVAIVGQSKGGKSLYALLMAVCIAMGLPFLDRVTVRRRVYVANLEVSAKQYKKRLRKICEALNIAPADLRGWLFICNLKGESATWELCRTEAKQRGCAVVLVDPFYQIFKGDEVNALDCQNAVEEMKKYQREGLTLIVVFHSPKGFQGDKQLIDMISGSSILARFPESIIGLLNYASNRQRRVMKAILRNYAPPDDITLTLEDGIFRVDGDVDPVVETQNSRKSAEAQKSNEEIAKIVLEVLKTNGMQKSTGTLVATVQDECQRKWGTRPGQRKVQTAVNSMIDNGVLIQDGRASIRGGAKAVGTVEQMTDYQRRTRNGYEE